MKSSAPWGNSYKSALAQEFLSNGTTFTLNQICIMAANDAQACYWRNPDVLEF